MPREFCQLCIAGCAHLPDVVPDGPLRQCFCKGLRCSMWMCGRLGACGTRYLVFKKRWDAWGLLRVRLGGLRAKSQEERPIENFTQGPLRLRRSPWVKFSMGFTSWDLARRPPSRTRSMPQEVPMRLVVQKLTIPALLQAWVLSFLADPAPPQTDSQVDEMGIFTLNMWGPY